MSFFRRKGQNEIPPVEPKGPPPSRSPAPGSKYSYVESRDRNRYDDNQQPSSGGYRGGYEGGAGGYNPPRDGAQDALRSELFAGYNPERAGPNRFADNARGPELREPAPGEENEEDVEGIKQQVRATKQESVNSTRNALRLAREAEDSARGTLLKLGDQSEKLANTERHLDISKNHSLRADDNADELKKLNKSIFNPSSLFTLDKEGKRAAKEAKIQARYEEDREERERTLRDVRESKNTVGNATTYGVDEGGNRRQLNGAQQAARKEQRKRYQFEATQSDDDMEDELDDNLGEIGDATKRLKALGLAMGQELDTQNQRIDRISDKATGLDTRLHGNTQKLKKIK